MKTLLDSKNAKYYDEQGNFNYDLYDTDYDNLINQFVQIDKKAANKILIIEKQTGYDGKPLITNTILDHVQDILPRIAEEDIKVYISRRNLKIDYTYKPYTPGKTNQRKKHKQLIIRNLKADYENKKISEFENLSKLYKMSENLNCTDVLAQDKV